MISIDFSINRFKSWFFRDFFRFGWFKSIFAAFNHKNRFKSDFLANIFTWVMKSKVGKSLDVIVEFRFLFWMRLFRCFSVQNCGTSYSFMLIFLETRKTVHKSIKCGLFHWTRNWQALLIDGGMLFSIKPIYILKEHFSG